MISLPFRARPAILACLLLCLGACAISSRSSSWLNPDYNGGPFRKIAVFVLTEDEGIRRFAEDQVVRRLPPGSAGVAGYSLFPKVSESDKDRVRERLVADGFDAALVTRLISVEKTRQEIPAQQIHSPATSFDTLGPYRSSLGGYYGYASGSANFPARTIETTTVVIETMAYKLPEGTPAWAGTTQAIDPQSKPELAEMIAGIVGEELVKKGLVGVPAR